MEEESIRIIIIELLLELLVLLFPLLYACHFLLGHPVFYWLAI